MKSGYRLLAVGFVCGASLLMKAPSVFAQATGGQTTTGATGTAAPAQAATGATLTTPAFAEKLLTSSGAKVAPTNPFINSYGNPLGLGIGTTAAAGATTTGGRGGTGATASGKGGAFGAATLVGSSTTTAAGRAGAAVGGRAGATTMLPGFTTANQLRAPAFQTGLSSDIPLVNHDPVVLNQQLQSAVQSATFIQNIPGVNVALQNGVYVIQGQAATPRERRQIENYLATFPGVRNIRNELVVVNPAPN